MFLCKILSVLLFSLLTSVATSPTNDILSKRSLSNARPSREIFIFYSDIIKRWAVYDHGYEDMPRSGARERAWDILRTEFELEESPSEPFRGSITSGRHQTMRDFWENLEKIFEPAYASLKFEPWTYLSKEYPLERGSHRPTAEVGSQILIKQWAKFERPSDKIYGNPPLEKLSAWNKAAEAGRNILGF